MVLKRVRPPQAEIRRVATQTLPFRGFRTRQVKDGHFVVAVEPGAYELVEIAGGDLWATTLVMDEDGKRATRFAVSRPAVLDLGVVHVAPDGFASYTVTLRAPPNDPDRAEILRAAIAGTKWERLEIRGVHR